MKKKKQQNTTQESTKLSQTSWSGGNISGYTQLLSQISTGASSWPTKLPDLDNQGVTIQSRWCYDHTFQLKAAAKKNLKWVDTDNTLLHISFSAQGNPPAGRCKHCLSLYHTSAECSWDFGTHVTSKFSDSTPDKWYNNPSEYAISGILIQLPNAPLRTASSLINAHFLSPTLKL